MRFHTTTEFENVKRAWRDAYAAHDTYAEAGDDFSAEAQAASEAEYVTLRSLLAMPASTPTEIADKLSIMIERDIDSGWTEWYPPIMAQLVRDLREQQRPCVSPSMRRAFDGWREAHRAAAEDTIGDETHDNALFSAADIACCTLMAAPCYTPGDFMVKVYVEMLGEHGYPRGGFAFEIHSSDLTVGLGTSDGAAREAFVRDINDTDLGACLLALGRVDFDAEAWLAAADLAGVTVHMVAQPDGSSGLCCGTAPRGEASYPARRRSGWSAASIKVRVGCRGLGVGLRA